MRKLMNIMADEGDGYPVIDDLAVTEDGTACQRIQEGKFIDGRFDRNIRIDQPTHVAGDGMVHAHILGRKGNQLVVVNIDGTASHGSKGILHQKDADALKKRGFTIRDDNIVEWTVLGNYGPELLLG